MPTFVQGQMVTSAGSTGTGAASSASMTAGNFVIVWIGWGSTAVTLDSVTDGQGNTYTLVDNPTHDSDRVGAWAWTVLGGSSTNTITPHFSTTATLQATAWHELTGATVNVADPIDARDLKRISNSTLVDGVATDAFTPATDGCYIFGVAHWVTASQTVSTGTGYVDRVTHSGAHFGHTEDSTQTTAGSTVVTFTRVPGISVMSVAGIAIKPAAAGGGSTLRPRRRTLMGMGA